MKIFISLSLIALFLISFTTKKNKKFKSPENFVFIPSGTSQLNDKTYSCAAFFMQEHEVTNLEYRTFLTQLKKEGKTEEYKKSYPDTTQWSTVGGDMAPMQNMYFWHPAYDNYPVVNITKEGASLFCVYLSKHYRAIYGDVINDFRLPTKYEWVYAAKAGNEDFKYSWGNSLTKDSKGKCLGNYNPNNDDTNKIYDDGAFITAKANTYSPNDYGLYNMSGNVAELVAKEDISLGGHWNSSADQVLITSEEEFEKANPFVGFRPVLSYTAQK